MSNPKITPKPSEKEIKKMAKQIRLKQISTIKRRIKSLIQEINRLQVELESLGV